MGLLGRDPSLRETKSVPTAYFSNRNFPGTDDHSGAGFALWSVEEGAVDSGHVELIAYGHGDGPLANSIRFRRRSGPDEITDSMVITGEGRVGIGTIRPEATLDVAGDMQIGGYELTTGIILHDTVDGKAYRLTAQGQWSGVTESHIDVSAVDVDPGTDEAPVERTEALLPPADLKDQEPSDLAARLAKGSTGTAALSLGVDEVGDDWVRFETEDGGAYSFRYHRAVEERAEYRSAGLDAVPALAIVPPVAGPETRTPMITENGRLYLGFGNEIVSPHSGVPYAFAADGPVLVGDINPLGSGPRRIGFRHVPLSEATPTYIHSNRNFAGTDTEGGAGIGLWSDEAGAAESGQLQLIAYGQGTGARANSICFATDGHAPGGNERMCVDSRGRVGIGTTAPAKVLDVRGEVIIGTADEPAGIIFHDESDGSAWRLRVTSGKIELDAIES
jgi:hypothetical protein